MRRERHCFALVTIHSIFLMTMIYMSGVIANSGRSFSLGHFRKTLPFAFSHYNQIRHNGFNNVTPERRVQLLFSTSPSSPDNPSSIQEETTSTSTSTNTSTNTSTAPNNINNKKRKKKKNGNQKEKRREFIGKAKAVDRGQWSSVYSPGGKDCISFTANSGLPNRSKPFTVLGIESSCDDTGG